ncbi:aspartate carbamoyltransferase catalytic subunit [Alteromonadaceae bacterium 2753L.S.0a.02]|nr:aspartate carbamoyltransferase catalytic subunit [Alteromonadaceae bacterium 2753L.S.0a.02]
MVKQKTSSHAATGEQSHAVNRERPEVYGNAHPKALLRAIMEEGDHLLPLENQHVLCSDQFDQQTLLQLFRLAAKYEANPERFRTPLQGKILISAFYEPSTRTRLSFESAWHRLGGDIMSITDRSTTGIAKGESLGDVGEMFNNYADCVVLRDTRAESLTEMKNSLRIPIINAGNGVDEHPTQAMADIYTIFKWRPELILKDIEESRKIRIGIIGVPHKMRTVHSLLKIFSVFPYAFSEVLIFSNEPESNDDSLLQKMRDRGLNVNFASQRFEQEVATLDVVYINAIAWVGDSYETYGNEFKLDASTPLKKGAIVLHPLARGEELSVDLDNTEHNWYFSQARGAVFVRMALLTCLVHRKGRVLDVV